LGRMKLSTQFLILLAVCYTSTSTPNLRQNFCQEDRCLTCVGKYCTTTCQGEGCKTCPLGDCCDGSSCNICRGENCCKTAECNACVNTCLKKCQESATCHYDCFQECSPGPADTNEYRGGHVISNKNYLPVNVTTIINITNTIKNENVFHNPIIVNTTNYNNYSSHGTKYHRKHVIINASKKNVTRVNCCEVVHPEVCYKQNQENVCYTKKHSECSQLCVGHHVHIIEDKEQKRQCITLKISPNLLCGNYIVENCDNCYTCTDTTDCTESANCSENCKVSIIPQAFYNKMYRKH
jgi:hypothetical protein